MATNFFDKMSYNSVCVKNFCEILAPIVRLSGMGQRMLPIAFFTDRHFLPWQQHLRQNGLYRRLRKRFLRNFCAYKRFSVDGPSNAENRKKFLQDFCAHKKVFSDGPSNAANHIFLRSTLVARTTKVWTKYVINLFA